MNHELAKTLTTALVQFIDSERPEETMCCSNTECKSIEEMFEGDKFDIIEAFIQKKLSKLTEFENKLVSFALQCGGQWDTANEEAKKWSHEFITLAKKELARRDEVITLDNLSPYDKGFQDGKADAMADLERTCFCNPDKLPKWLKNYIATKELNAHTKGYNKGYKDAEQWYNDWVAARNPIMPTPPSGWGCDGTHCTNPHHDCINCPLKYSSGGTITTPNTASSISEGNTSATDGKEHNPSFTD